MNNIRQPVMVVVATLLDNFGDSSELPFPKKNDFVANFVAFNGINY